MKELKILKQKIIDARVFDAYDAICAYIDASDLASRFNINSYVCAGYAADSYADYVRYPSAIYAANADSTARNYDASREIASEYSYYKDVYKKIAQDKLIELLKEAKWKN